MSTVREFNPPRSSGRGQPGRYSVPSPPSGIYRPSFAVGREASNIVRERLRALKIGKEVRRGPDRGRVLLNQGSRENLTAREAGESAGRGARRVGGLLSRAGRAVGRGAIAAAHGAAEFSRGARAGVRENSTAVAAPPRKRRAKKPAARRHKTRDDIEESVKAASIRLGPKGHIGPGGKVTYARPTKAQAEYQKKHGKKRPAAKKKPMPKGVSRACAKKGILIPEAKARQILKDGNVRGKPLTKEQRGLMGLVAGGCKTPKGAAARARAKKLDAERKAGKPRKAKKSAVPAASAARPGKKAKKAKSKKPAKAKSKPKAKKPARSKTTKRTAKAAKPRRWKGSVKGQISVSGSRELVPSKKTKKSQVPAASAVTKAKAAPAKAKKSSTRRQKQVAATTKKRAGRKKPAAKAKTKKHNKHKKSHKAKKHNKKRKKKNQQQSGGYFEGAVKLSQNKGKGKGKGKKRKHKKRGRRNTPEGTAELQRLLGGKDLKSEVRRAVAAEQGQRAMASFNKKIDAVLNKLTKLGYNDGPKVDAAVATLADIFKKAGIGAGYARVPRPRKKAAAAVPAATAAKPAKKKGGKKPAKAKKANKGKKKPAKAKKAKKNGKKASKGKKKPAKAKKAKKAEAKKASKKRGKAKKHPHLTGSLHGSVDLHEVRQNRGKRKRSNSGAVLVSNGMIGDANDWVGDKLKWVPVLGSPLGAIWDNKSGVIGLGLGVAGSHVFPALPVVSDFAKSGWWQKLIATAVGGVVGVGITSIVSPYVAGLYTEPGDLDDEVTRQVAFAAVGAAGSLVSAMLNKATTPDSNLRVLNGTDPASLSDYVGLNDVGYAASPGQVKEEPKGLPMAADPGPDQWSSALDYGDAKFDPIGFEPDMFSDSSIMDFAQPAIGDFAQPAGMGEPWSGKPERGTWNAGGGMSDDLGDFAAPGIADMGEDLGMVDELADFAQPAMNDFAAPA